MAGFETAGPDFANREDLFFFQLARPLYVMCASNKIYVYVSTKNFILLKEEVFVLSNFMNNWLKKTTNLRD
jgi:hypothetical protein